jgi:hypothetical protein
VNFNIQEHTIFRCLSGSHAYGMATPESDEDFRGVAIPPKEYFLGFMQRFEQSESKPSPGHDVPDEVIYDIRKFVSLAADNNPNVMELLFMPEDTIVHSTPWWERLTAIRESFLSTRVRYTYGGYAVAQLKRIRQHRNYLLNPPKKRPERSDFGLPENQAFVDFKTKVEEANKAGLDARALFGEDIQKEARYNRAMADFHSWETWKKNRNPKRAELEAKFGYDSKHAAHLVRLMRQGCEILETGKVFVRRPDAEELLAIRRDGIWSYDQLVAYAEEMEARLSKIYDEKLSPLPANPDRKRIDDTVVGIVSDFLGL